MRPFHSDADPVFDPALLGTWGDSAGPEYVVVTEGSQGSYSLVYTSSEGKKGHFVGQLINFDGITLMDMAPAEPEWDVDDTYRSLFIPAHVLMLLEQQGSAVKFAFLNLERLRDHLRAMRRPLPYTELEDRLVLTSSTSELRDFFTEYIKTEGAFDEPDIWVRRSGH